ncbi:MAG TPA: malate synthase A [Micromonosporaceae bacterium]
MPEILSHDAVAFVDELQRRFKPRRDELLARRAQRRAELSGNGLDFLPQTREIRESSWRVPPPPPGLLDRRVEITGPTERKMTINALNSGAKVWLADLEDANTPHWTNVVGGQANLYDAVRGTISYEAPDGRHYALTGGPRPTIVMRPRGWHLPERHLPVAGEPGVGALVDAGLYLFHNAHELLARGSGPYLYLPKLESHLEAALWHDVFTQVEQSLGLAEGTIRATVLIETIAAAFEMDEILWALGPHAAGLNAGRWDYLFSIIKTFREHGPAYVLPDRGAVTMTAPFLRAYTDLLVATCHRRGAMAIGGMAAFIPSRRDPEVNAVALAKVREDKEREARDGFDGSWVAHPDLVPICAEVFGQVLGERPNQIDRRRDEVQVTAADLLDVASTPGRVTEAGVRTNVSVGVRYLASWLAGNGAAAIDNLMEDAATAEISRSQLWQWLHNETTMDTGDPVTAALVRRILDEELARLGDEYRPAGELFANLALAQRFDEFLTLVAYELID